MEEKLSPNDRVTRWRRRYSALKTDRSSWIPHYEDLCRFIKPRSARFFVSDRNKGYRRDRHILNNRATIALRRCSAGLMSGLSSPASPWFKLADNDLGAMGNVDVGQWTYICTQIMQSVMARSNVYTQLMLVYDSTALYGTGAMGVYEDDEHVVRCEFYPVGSYVLANNAFGRVDTFYREYKLSVRQMAQKFGVDKLSDHAKNLFDRGEHDKLITIMHVIEPNDEYSADKAESRFKRYRSVHFESPCREGKLLRDSGFDEFPIMGVRWSLTGEDTYGESPAMVALGDVKELQAQEFRKSEAIEKSVNPPMVAPTSLRNQGASLRPGEITYFDSTVGLSKFEPAMQVNLDISDLRADSQAIEQRIADAFYEDVFLAITGLEGDGRTATEITQRIQERLLQLGPTILQFNDDLFNPLIERIFSICMRRGLFPDPPQELQGRRLNIEYTGMLQQALRGSGLTAIQQYFAFVAQVAQVNPEAMDVIAIDPMMDETAHQGGVADIILNDQQTRVQLRQQRAQAQQQQQQAEQMRQQAAAVKQGASAARDLSQVPSDGDNALSTIVNAAQDMRNG